MIKYSIKRSNNFKKQYKKLLKQGKNMQKLEEVLIVLASGKTLDKKYMDHALRNNKYYKNCRECHIEPDWLLVYQYQNDVLILLLVTTGSHSELFNM